jgi:hypothetical protein
MVSGIAVSFHLGRCLSNRIVIISLKFSAYLRPSLVDRVHNPNDDIQAVVVSRLLGCLDGLQGDASASSGDVREYAVFDRIMFRTVRCVMCDADLQLQATRELPTKKRTRGC